jgi:hypothetical protein
MPECARCQQPSEALTNGVCGYCTDIVAELAQSETGKVPFRRAMEIADKHGLLTDSMRQEWLEAQ